MNAWKVILATLVIFGAGIVTGGLLVKHQHAPFSAPIATAQPVVSPVPRPDNAARGTNRPFGSPLMSAGARKDFLKNLDRDLELTPEQRERVEKILSVGQEHTKQLWDQVSPKMHAEWKRVKEEIRTGLTEEQKQKFEECMKRSRKQEERKPQPSRDDQPPKAEPPQSAPAETPSANP